MPMSRQSLIEDNMNLVHFVIHRYYPESIKDEDIIQCGMVGLCKAADTWDETTSKFSSYASRCIGYEINNEIKRRKRWNKTSSLDQPVEGKDNDVCSLGDLIAGDKDVDYVNVRAFHDQLKPKDQSVFALMCEGLTVAEIAERIGVSRRTAHTYTRKIRTLWRNYYGD